MANHAILSPSAAERWLNCTPSARLEQQFPDTSGEAAAEGTLAHALGELILKLHLKHITKPKYTVELNKIKLNKLYDDNMFGFASDYADFVLEQFYEAKSHTSDALIFLEQKLNLTDYVPEGFGTGDAIIVADNVLTINDLKYGKGVPVSAENNRQMMLYALGALKEFDFLYNIHTVRATIYQPRINNISTFEISVEELKSWAETELIPKAKLAFEGVGEYLPGAHCRFCKARAVCKANAENNLQLAKYDFQKEELLSDEEIADILDRAAPFKNWLDAVEDYALNQAITNNKKWPRYKLVEGRSNRTYTDEEKIVNTLLQNGYTEDQIYTKKILPITNLEKAITKTKFAELLNDFIIKPPGKPTLAPESDKRPAYNSNEAAKNDFLNN